MIKRNSTTTSSLLPEKVNVMDPPLNDHLPHTLRHIVDL